MGDNSDNTSELKRQIREGERTLRTAENALKDAKYQRLKLSLGSAAAGFLLFAIGGHWFPGYQLDSTANANSQEVAAGAVSDVMAQICAERFMEKSGLESRLAAMTGESGSWSQANYIRDGIWAATPDGEKSDHATAEKCRSLIVDRVSAESERASG